MLMANGPALPAGLSCHIRLARGSSAGRRTGTGIAAGVRPRRSGGWKRDRCNEHHDRQRELFHGLLPSARVQQITLGRLPRFS
jgi:hypothetical protein